MKRLFSWLVTCLMLFALSAEVFAQNQVRTISGIVMDNAGEPLGGTSVIDTKTKNGTIADAEGKFTIQISSDSQFIFSFMGFLDQKFTAAQMKNGMVVTMKPDAQSLQELVVVGYGSQRKETLTGAVSQINNKELVTTKNENLTNAMAGKIAGVRVVQNSSEPGNYDSSMDIRGMGAPLVVIDGVPRDTYERVNPEDVESISVLKDASAAIYGVKAANGVILITTKKGSNQATRVTYNGSYSFQRFSNFPDVVDAPDWMMLANEKNMHNIDWGSRLYTDEQIDEYRTGKKESVDWRGAIFKDFAPQTQHGVNISGGNDRFHYYTSMGYNYQGSFFKSNDNYYNKFNLRSNIGGKITDNLSFEVKVLGMMDQKDSPYHIAFDIIRLGLLQNPLNPIYCHDGKDFNGDWNPVALMEKDVTGYRRYKNKWFQSSAALTWDIPWVEGLQLSGLYSFDYHMNDYKVFAKKWVAYVNDWQWVCWHNDPSNVERGVNEDSMNLFNIKLDYQNEFNGHNVGAHLVYEESWRQGDNFAGKKDILLPIDQIFAGRAENQQFWQGSGQGDLYKRANKAFIGRFNYNYQSRYLMEFAFRYEGSSMFPKESRWKFFPSVSAGWRISEEPFFKNAGLDFIDNLKLRTSYGILGDDSVLAYQYVQGYRYPEGGYWFDGKWMSGLETTGPANKAISWVKAETFNVGLDFGAWNGKLGVVAEYFFRERSGLLASRNASLPGVVGTSMPQENLNGDFTQGFELELSHKNHVNDFNYEIKGNVSFTRTNDTYIERQRSGNSYLNWKENYNDRKNNVWFGYSGDERFTNWNDIYYSDVFIGRGSILGDYKYEDWNHDGQINDLDLHPIAHSGDKPMINFGATFSASWKGFDLNLLFQGSALRTISYVQLFQEPMWAGCSGMKYFLNRWHPKDAFADPYNPELEWVEGKFGYTGSFPNENSSFNMNHAAYLRLKNLELGYTIPEKLVHKVGINSLRVYLSTYNLFTISGNLNYVDPEFPSWAWGYNYPLNKTVTLGLNLKF